MFPLMSEVLKHKEALITVLSVMGATLLYFLYIIYRSHKYHLKDLKALGLYRDETKEVRNEKTGLRERRVSSKIKVRWKGNKLIFSKYNRAFSLNDFERLKPNLEILFDKKIELIKFEKQFWSSQPRAVLITEAFPEKFLLSQRPKLKIGQIFLGIDALSNFVILEAIKDFECCLIVLSPKGGGKSVLLNGIITSFFETLEENNRSNEYELIVIDNKGTDFIDVIKRFNGSYYQPFNIDDLRALVEKLKITKKEIEDTLAHLKANGISVRHWDEIRNGKIDFPVPSKKFIFYDEFKAYFGSGKSAPKLSKEPSEDELLQQERFLLIRELGNLTNFFAEQCRSTGIILCCASQSPNKSDYDYPDFINFLGIYGKCNQQQSIQLVGDSSLNDPTLTRGKFVLRDENGSRRFLAPLSIVIKDTENDSK